MIVETADTETAKRVRDSVVGAHEAILLSVYGKDIVAISGDERKIDVGSLKALPGVLNVIDTMRFPFYLASRNCKSADSVVQVGNVAIGGHDLVVIAGPCAVENLEDTLETAKKIRGMGAHLIRGGAYKPRTTPYNFQGLGVEGLRILAEVRERIGVGVVSEVMSPEQAAVGADYLDMLQVGTRNMTNTELLKSLGRLRKPVLLKRGLNSTIVDLLKAAEFIIYGGNPNVVLCERGIKTHETATRNTLDLSAVPVLKQMGHLPVIVDPSHATGQARLVPVMSKCAVLAGADGLLIEVHVAPERMIRPGDADQALRPHEFMELFTGLKDVAELAGRSLAALH